MGVKAFIRWKGGNEADMVQAAKEARPMFLRHGASDMTVSRFNNGAFLGEWLVTVEYPNWTAYGRAQDGLGQDKEFQALSAKVASMAQVVGRTTLKTYDLS